MENTISQSSPSAEQDDALWQEDEKDLSTQLKRKDVPDGTASAVPWPSAQDSSKSIHVHACVYVPH